MAARTGSVKRHGAVASELAGDPNDRLAIVRLFRDPLEQVAVDDVKLVRRIPKELAQ